MFYKVIGRHSVALPDGRFAEPGEVFNSNDEKMSPNRINRLLSGKCIQAEVVAKTKEIKEEDITTTEDKTFKQPAKRGRPRIRFDKNS